jgi:hypothetical protein
MARSRGRLWLEPTTAFVVDVGAIANSFRTLNLPVPAGLPVGLAIAVQSIAVASAGAEFSLPALLTLP